MALRPIVATLTRDASSKLVGARLLSVRIAPEAKLAAAATSDTNQPKYFFRRAQLPVLRGTSARADLISPTPRFQ